MPSKDGSLILQEPIFCNSCNRIINHMNAGSREFQYEVEGIMS